MSGPQDASQVMAVLNAAGQGRLSAAQLAQQLQQLDAYRGLARANPIAAASAAVADALPKTAFGGAAAQPVDEQLEGKRALHSSLLQLLEDAGALQRLHASSLRCLLEDGQRLAAAAALRGWEAKQEGLAGGLHEAIRAAGRACACAADAGSGAAERERDAEELFYARPTASTGQLLREVAAAAAALAGARPDGAAAADLKAVEQLNRGVGELLGGAAACRAKQQQQHGPALAAAVAGLDEPEWTAGADVRAALQSLADALSRLHPRLAQEAPQEVGRGVTLLAEVADRLLNAHAAALAAAPPGAQRAALHGEYAAVRDAVLGELLRQSLALEDPDALPAVRRVQGLAEAHRAYRQLCDVADLLGDAAALHAQMAQLRGDGLDPPLTAHVFDRLLRQGRHAELLDLPQQFDAELQRFLSEEGLEGGEESGEAGEESGDDSSKQRLRWLHELRVGDYAGAAETLGQLAQAQAAAGDAAGAQRAAALQRLAGVAACPLWPLAGPAGA